MFWLVYGQKATATMQFDGKCEEDIIVLKCITTAGLLRLYFCIYSVCFHDTVNLPKSI